MKLVLVLIVGLSSVTDSLPPKKSGHILDPLLELDPNYDPDGPFCFPRKPCYNDPEPLGCFPIGPTTKFCHQVVAPDSPIGMDVEFLMYTPEMKQDDFGIIDFYHGHLDNSVRTVQYNESRDLWVMVHGFVGEWPKEWMGPMKNALRDKGHNVLFVRWTKGSKAPNYLKATANTRVVGAMVARVLTVMSEQRSLDIANKVTVLGFSLGAHVAGLAGQALDGQLKMIVGLDPAGPLFAGYDPATRLDPTDAKFVLSQHCNGDSIFYGGAGTLEQMGHIDFYPNGGKIQAGCNRGLPQAGDDIYHMNVSNIMNDLKCSHNRCAWLFTTSIYDSHADSECQFTAFPCPSTDNWLSGQCFQCESIYGCPKAGYPINPSTLFRGKYFFDTRANNATKDYYCGQQFLISAQFASSLPEGAEIAIKFYYYRGSPPFSQAVKYLDPKDKKAYKRGDVLAKVLIAPPDFNSLTAIDITYTPTGSSDPYQVLLRDISFRDINGKKYLDRAEISLEPGVPVAVNFD